MLQYGVDQGKMLMSTAQGETSIGREITEMTSDEVLFIRIRSKFAFCQYFFALSMRLISRVVAHIHSKQFWLVFFVFFGHIRTSTFLCSRGAIGFSFLRVVFGYLLWLFYTSKRQVYSFFAYILDNSV